MLRYAKRPLSALLKRTHWDGFAEKHACEIFLCRYPGEGGLMSAGVLFPEREVIDVCFLIAPQRRGFDPVRVVGLTLGIDELVVSGPLRAGFGLEIGRENDHVAVALAEMSEDRFGIGGEEEIG